MRETKGNGRDKQIFSMRHDSNQNKVVMDGSARPDSPQRPCICLCVCVWPFTYQLRRWHKMLGCLPLLSSPLPLPVYALPSRQPYVKSPLSAPHGTAEFYLTCPALEIWCWLKSAREGQIWKKKKKKKRVTIRASNITPKPGRKGRDAWQGEDEEGAAPECK